MAGFPHDLAAARSHNRVFRKEAFDPFLSLESDIGHLGQPPAQENHILAHFTLFDDLTALGMVGVADVGCQICI